MSVADCLRQYEASLKLAVSRGMLNEIQDTMLPYVYYLLQVRLPSQMYSTEIFNPLASYGEKKWPWNSTVCLQSVTQSIIANMTSEFNLERATHTHTHTALSPSCVYYYAGPNLVVLSEYT